MKGNGLIVWLMAGGGLILMYAAYKGSTIADVLSGKAGSTSAKPSSVKPNAPLSASNPFGTIVPPNSKPIPGIPAVPGFPTGVLYPNSYNPNTGQLA